MLVIIIIIIIIGFPHCLMCCIPEDTIDENYGVPVVFHEDEEEGGRHGEVMEVQEEEADEEEEGVETEYDGVLHAGVSVEL